MNTTETTTTHNARRFVSVKQAAAILELGNPSSIYIAIQKGTLAAVRIGKHIRIETVELERFIANGGTAPRVAA